MWKTLKEIKDSENRMHIHQVDNNTNLNLNVAPSLLNCVNMPSYSRQAFPFMSIAVFIAGSAKNKLPKN